MDRSIQRYSSQNPNHRLLIVFDIDDTLLTSAQFFGGDALYRWQSGDVMQTEGGDMVRISDDEKLQCIFAKLDVLFELARFRPTQDDAHEVVRRLQGQHSVFALTSRSPGARSGTERELGRAQIDLASSHLMAPGRALDFRLRGRGVTYANGIVMSTGLDKGVVLHDILARIDKQHAFDAIFMIDDGANNLANVNGFWKDKAIDVRLFHYTRVPKTVSPSELKEATQANQRLNAFINSAFPDRRASFDANQCD
ncbi:MAG: DUF2608 domain-containing protein [Pseudomonadota bacterium]